MPEKDPSNYSLITYLWVVALAGVGGGSGAIGPFSGGTLGTAGAANTGGGGGGGCGIATGENNSANGGSGIVIIRYSSTYAVAAATTGSPTYSNSGGYHIYIWTASGSITF